MKHSNEVYPSHLEEYSEKYKEFIKFHREDGILQLTFHYKDGPLKWSGGPQAAILRACEDITHDPENECLIITGTGDAFNGQMLTSDIGDDAARLGSVPDYRTPYSTFDWWYHIQTREPMAIANLQIPVIGACNGPIFVHPELIMCSDIVLCSDDTTFREWHFSDAGVPCGDGTWPLWKALVGPNRARYMMWMGKPITAQQALEWGVVNEVLPREDLLPRAWEIARFIMSRPRHCRRLQHTYLSQQWRDEFNGELEFGLGLEGYATVMDSPMWPDDKINR